MARPEHILKKKHKHYSFSQVLLNFNSFQSSVINIQNLQVLLFNLHICVSTEKISILLLANIHKTTFLSYLKVQFPMTSTKSSSKWRVLMR